MAEKKSRRALQRGLKALLSSEVLADAEPEAKNESPRSGALALPVAEIASNPFQPREDFNPDALEELKNSIARHGVLEPVLVRRSKGGYELISGERRLRAVRALGQETIPAIVRDKVSDRQMEIIAMVENLQRSDLNDMELAAGYNGLMVQHSFTHEKLAEEMGKSRSSVSNIMRLLKLPDEIQQAVRENKISGGHARTLLGAADEDLQLALLQRIIDEGLSVREIEALVSGQKKPAEKTKANKSAKEHDLTELENKLTRFFKTRVEIRKSGTRGKLIIHFTDTADLNRITELLK